MVPPRRTNRRKDIIMTTLHVIGDSITYLVKSHGGVGMFANNGITAVLDGDPGERADTPTRWDAWRAAAATRPDALIFALGCNDLMKETFKDNEISTDPRAIAWSELEHATLISTLYRSLSYAHQLVPQAVVGWVNVTTRTMSGYYNTGARRVNATMKAVCTQNGWIYIDWDACKAPTTDLIHPKPTGSIMWVNAVADALLVAGVG